MSLKQAVYSVYFHWITSLCRIDDSFGSCIPLSSAYSVGSVSLGCLAIGDFLSWWLLHRLVLGTCTQQQVAWKKMVHKSMEF